MKNVARIAIKSGKKLNKLKVEMYPRFFKRLPERKLSIILN